MNYKDKRIKQTTNNLTPEDKIEISNLIMAIHEHPKMIEKHMTLDIGRWDDTYGSWRVGLNWNMKDDGKHVFHCEYLSIITALNSCLEYLETTDIEDMEYGSW